MPAPDAAPSVIRVRLSTGSHSEIAFSITGNYSIPSGRLPEGRYRVRNNGGRLSLVNAGGTVLASVSGPLMIQENRGGGSFVSLRTQGYQRSFQGSMKFWPNGSAVDAVNHVPLEKYLYGVVAYEMSDGFPLEALKAQAVAARCYAVKRLEGLRGSRHDIGDTSSDQVYKGYPASASRVRQAVDATAGQVLQYKGTTIVAYYAASNGGQTERAENVWSTTLPYAKLRADPYDLANASSKEQVVYIPAGSTADKPADKAAGPAAPAKSKSAPAPAPKETLYESTRLTASGRSDSVKGVPLTLGPATSPQADALLPNNTAGVDGQPSDVTDPLPATTDDPSAGMPVDGTDAGTTGTAGSPADAAPAPAGPAPTVPAPTPTPVPLAAAGPGIPDLEKFDASGLVKIQRETYLRTGPGDRFSRVSSLKPGLKVMIVAPGRTWHYVEYDGQFGYVSADCTNAPVADPPAPTATPAAPPAVSPPAAATPATAATPAATGPAASDPAAPVNPADAPLQPAAAAQPLPQPETPASPPPQPTVSQPPAPPQPAQAEPTAPPQPPSPTLPPAATKAPQPTQAPSAPPKAAAQSVEPRVAAPPAAWTKPATDGVYADERMDRRLADFLKTQAVHMLNGRNARTPSGSRFLVKPDQVRIKAILDMNAIQTPSALQCHHDPNATDLPPHTAGNCPSVAYTGIRMKILLKVTRENAQRTGGLEKVDFTWDFQFTVSDWLKSSSRPQWQLFTPGNGLRIYAVEKVRDDKGAQAFALVNRRYGHGVGMSQRGAQQRAKDPNPAISQYQNILAFYYPGTVLVKTGLSAPALPAAPAGWAGSLPPLPGA